jgi:Cd2+/Zn2+-exporting ATPase
LAWLTLGAGFLAGASGYEHVRTALFALSIVCGAFYFAREAVEELVRERVIGIELLMTAAIAGAIALGQWREAALVAALYSISEALDSPSSEPATRFALMDLVPPKARVLVMGAEVRSM